MLAPKESATRQLPSWPAGSIVLLVLIAPIVPAALLTGMNLYLPLLALIVWLSSKERFDPNLLRSVAPFGLIIVIGLVAGIGSGQYLYLKDARYMSNPAVIIGVGYVLYRCKPDVARGLRALVIGGTLAALLYLSSFAAHPDLIFQSAVQIRETVGTGHYAPALAFTIFCSYFRKWSEGLKLPKWLAVCCFTICVPRCADL